jgi:hypothetical protein
MTERLIGILAGTWLVSSAFIWRHSQFQKVNAIVCGFLAIGIAVVNIYAPRGRYLAGLLALWIFLSAVFTFPIAEITLWSNALCAVGIGIGVHASGPRRAAFS